MSEKPMNEKSVDKINKLKEIINKPANGKAYKDNSAFGKSFHGKSQTSNKGQMKTTHRSNSK